MRGYSTLGTVIVDCIVLHYMHIWHLRIRASSLQFRASKINMALARLDKLVKKLMSNPVAACNKDSLASIGSQGFISIHRITSIYQHPQDHKYSLASIGSQVFISIHRITSIYQHGQGHTDNFLIMNILSCELENKYFVQIEMCLHNHDNIPMHTNMQSGLSISGDTCTRYFYNLKWCLVPPDFIECCIRYS